MILNSHGRSAEPEPGRERSTPLSKQQLLLLKRRNPAKYRRPADTSKGGRSSMKEVILERSDSDHQLKTTTSTTAVAARSSGYQKLMTSTLPGILTLETSTTRTRSLMRDISTTDELTSGEDRSSALRSRMEDLRTYYRDLTTEHVSDVKSESGNPSCSSVISESRRFGSGPSRLVSSRVVSRGSERRVVKDYVIEREVRVPKRVTREDVIEKKVVVLEKRLVEEIVHVPEKRIETVVHVRTPIVVEKIVEVPEYELVEKSVVVPEKIQMERPLTSTSTNGSTTPSLSTIQPSPCCSSAQQTKKRKIPVPVESSVRLELVLPTIRSVPTSINLPVFVPRFVEVPVTAEFCDENLLNTADKLSKELTEALSIEDCSQKVARLERSADELRSFTKVLYNQGILSSPTSQPIKNATNENFTKWWQSNEITFRGEFTNGDFANADFASSAAAICLDVCPPDNQLSTKNSGEFVTLVENPDLNRPSDGCLTDETSSESDSDGYHEDYSQEDDRTTEVEPSDSEQEMGCSRDSCSISSNMSSDGTDIDADDESSIDSAE